MRERRVQSRKNCFSERILSHQVLSLMSSPYFRMASLFREVGKEIEDHRSCVPCKNGEKITWMCTSTS